MPSTIRSRRIINETPRCPHCGEADGYHAIAVEEFWYSLSVYFYGDTAEYECVDQEPCDTREFTIYCDHCDEEICMSDLRPPNPNERNAILGRVAPI